MDSPTETNSANRDCIPLTIAWNGFRQGIEVVFLAERQRVWITPGQTLLPPEEIVYRFRLGAGKKSFGVRLSRRHNFRGVARQTELQVLP